MRPLLLLLLALSLPGCAPADPGLKWRREWTPAQAAKIETGLLLLQQAGLGIYARQVQEVMLAGRFHAAAGWQEDGSGWSACYVPNAGNVRVRGGSRYTAADSYLVEPLAVERYDAEDLGSILLREGLHRAPVVHTPDDEEMYRALDAVYRARVGGR